MEPVSSSTHVPGITGLVLTRDGGRLLDKCLASLYFCDTLLVVDSGSADHTLDIAEAHNAEIVARAWEGFARQFTFAHGLVRSRWFFILDQDEICPPALGAEIRAAIAEADALADTPADTPVAFSVGRKSWYFDRFMRHGGWYPDPIPRVFRTGFVEFYQDAHIHYRPLGSRRHLGGPGREIIHYPYAGFEHQLAKLNAYARQGADALKAGGRKGGLLPGVGHGLGRFCRIYVLKRGFLDGRAGFLAAAHGAFYAFLKYARTLDASWGAPFDQE
ncbi:MAG: glycosyltransferase family 2 protein [Desulfovibrio sp.]|jgi:glycosyltransferase involved in cell wall biosynthesis|nr:glycosyltransferase family 2 protein [Desulfovibrio sp.]